MEPHQPPPVPALSATILLLRERQGIEVLMVERGAGAFFGSALVFPGGKVDHADHDPEWDLLVAGADGLDARDKALRIAGWREVFEETRLLPAGFAVDAPGEIAFRERVRQAGSPLPIGAMQPFGRWITPFFASRRFDTNFFLCPLDGGEVVCDGFETVSAAWMSPQEAIARGESGEHKLLFPTRSQLHRLAQSGTIAEAMAAAAATPVVPIEPRREVRPDGVYLTIRSDAGYDYCQEMVLD